MLLQTKTSSAAALVERTETEADSLLKIVEDQQRKVDANWSSGETGPFPDDAISQARISNFRKLAELLVSIKNETGKPMGEVVATALSQSFTQDVYPFTREALEVLNQHFKGK